jgi:hypothetical protein
MADRPPAPTRRRRRVYEYVVYLVAALALAYGAGSLIWDSVRERRLRDNGLPAKATVVSISDTRSRVNGNPVVELQLNVVPSTGAPYPANLRGPISTVDLPRVQPGMTVDVVVDRDDPQHIGLAARR